MPHDTNRVGNLITLEFLEALESIYPLRSPDIHDSDRQVWLKAGQYSVVEFLRTKYEEANEDSLSRELLSR